MKRLIFLILVINLQFFSIKSNTMATTTTTTPTTSTTTTTTATSTPQPNVGSSASWGLCYSKNETVNPDYKDCLIIDKYCCYTSYTIVGYKYSACFYNNFTNNARADDWFKETMGAVIFAPSFNYTITCDSTYIGYKLMYIVIILSLSLLL